MDTPRLRGGGGIASSSLFLLVVVVVVVVVVSHIQRIGCQPEKTTLHGGQSRSWWYYFVYGLSFRVGTTNDGLYFLFGVFML